MITMSDKKNNNLLMKYAGMGAQFAGGILVGLFFGEQLDKWMKISFPLFIWFLPLFFIIGMLIRIVIDTNKKDK